MLKAILKPPWSGQGVRAKWGPVQTVIRDGSFRDGFEVGYRLVVGLTAVLPVLPVAPIVPVGSTAFLEGIKAGMKAAGKEI